MMCTNTIAFKMKIQPINKGKIIYFNASITVISPKQTYLQAQFLISSSAKTLFPSQSI